MAESVKTLIRVLEWEVDQKRRQLAIKLNALRSLEEEWGNLSKELIQEQEHSASGADIRSFYYANYGMEVIRKQEIIAKEIRNAVLEVNLVREELGEVYNELKRFEFISDKRDHKKNQELARKEQNILDDLGIQTFSRHRR